MRTQSKIVIVVLALVGGLAVLGFWVAISEGSIGSQVRDGAESEPGGTPLLDGDAGDTATVPIRSKAYEEDSEWGPRVTGVRRLKAQARLADGAPVANCRVTLRAPRSYTQTSDELGVVRFKIPEWVPGTQRAALISRIDGIEYLGVFRLSGEAESSDLMDVGVVVLRPPSLIVEGRVVTTAGLGVGLAHVRAGRAEDESALDTPAWGRTYFSAVADKDGAFAIVGHAGWSGRLRIQVQEESIVSAAPVEVGLGARGVIIEVGVYGQLATRMRLPMGLSSLSGISLTLAREHAGELVLVDQCEAYLSADEEDYAVKEWNRLLPGRYALKVRHSAFDQGRERKRIAQKGRLGSAARMKRRGVGVTKVFNVSAEFAESEPGRSIVVQGIEVADGMPQDPRVMNLDLRKLVRRVKIHTNCPPSAGRLDLTIVSPSGEGTLRVDAQDLATGILVPHGRCSAKLSATGFSMVSIDPLEDEQSVNLRLSFRASLRVHSVPKGVRVKSVMLGTDKGALLSISEVRGSKRDASRWSCDLGLITGLHHLESVTVVEKGRERELKPEREILIVPGGSGHGPIVPWSWLKTD